MGRWQTRIAVAEKITDTLPGATDKTDKTPPETVLSVSSVSSWSECRKFSPSEPVSSDAEVAASEWDERAAILEYDEGLTRAEAERLARQQTSKCGSATDNLSFADRPAANITISRPAVEVGADEYDAHLDALIAALPDGSAERNRLAFARKKGWCVERASERIFTRGRF